VEERRKREIYSSEVLQTTPHPVEAGSHGVPAGAVSGGLLIGVSYSNTSPAVRNQLGGYKGSPMLQDEGRVGRYRSH
jgi:hypothetical protein